MTIDKHPLSEVDPSDTQMELGTGACRIVFMYLEDKYSRDYAEEFFRCLKMNSDHIWDRNGWVSFAFNIRMLKLLVDRTANPNSPYEAGLYSTRRRSFGVLEVMISRLGTAASTYKLLPVLSPRWNKITTWKIHELRNNRCVLSVKSDKYPQDKNNCICMQGCVAALSHLHGLPPANVEEIECACDGADQCTYEITWLAKPKWLWSLVGCGAGASVAVWLWIALENGYAAVFALILGATAGRLIDYQTQLKRIYESNEEQAASLHASLKDIEDLNMDLQQKVESRTESLRIALAEQKKSEQKAIRAERQAAVGVLAAGMAHEINNPVNAIRLSIQTLLTKTDETGPMYPLLDNAFKATSRCARIVSDLLTFARKEQVVTQVDLKGVLGRSVEIFKKEDAGDVDVQLAIAEDIPMIEVDEQQMQQAILNLMINAGDAMKGHGRIDISLTRDGDEVVLSHSDSGPGVSEEMKTRIFDPFFSTKKGGSSKGMGLSITVELVRRNSGRIDLESVEGKGARFVLRFPVEKSSGE